MLVADPQNGVFTLPPNFLPQLELLTAHFEFRSIQQTVVALVGRGLQELLTDEVIDTAMANQKEAIKEMRDQSIMVRP